MSNDMKTINPATEQLIQNYSEMSSQDVKSIIESAHHTFLGWRETPFKARSELMKNAAKVLIQNKQKYALLITTEMGKVYKEALLEIEKCAWACEFYADHAERFLADEIVQTEAFESFITYQPLGVIFAVMPWNYPFWQVFRFAAPTLMAGNAGILKHASNVSGVSLAIQDVFRQAGFPENLFQSLLIGHDASAKVIENEYVRAVTLTGSTGAGRAVASKAGACLKKTVLELGGSDAYIILDDADLDNAVETCVRSRLQNTGQSCIAAKRFIVVEKVYEEFLSLLTNKMERVTYGDPLSPSTDMGPMASVDLRNKLHQQVLHSIEAGANCILGGKVPAGKGAFYPPTILTNVHKGTPAYQDELFGPVASVIKAKDGEDAVLIANDSTFGLGGAVFTKNIDKGLFIARKQMDSGACFVNQEVKSDPRLPFGGVKESGYGRELSWFGIREFVNIKGVSVKV